MAKTLSSETTQNFVPIKEVRDGVLVLKNGGLRSILLASSLNFALKSADEQSSITYQFQNFLNSLDFSVQIFVESRRLDIRPYVALLEERYKNQLTDLMKIQTREYIGFVKSFVENSNIMNKSFFVVIPYTPSVLSSGNKPSFGKGKADPNADSKSFDESRTQLDQRVSVVASGLTRSGIRVVQLGTEEIIELFYKVFNPGESDKPIKAN